MFSTLQKIGLGQLASRGIDPGANGTYAIGDLSLSVFPTTAVSGNDERLLPAASFVGQFVLVVNSGSNTIVVKDKANAPNTVATIEQNESALCVSTGIAAEPWQAVVFKQSAT